MVNAAEAYIVSPAVAAEDPYRLLVKEFLIIKNILANGAVCALLFKRGNKSLGSGSVLSAVVNGS